jgi:hypothetical protein
MRAGPAPAFAPSIAPRARRALSARGCLSARHAEWHAPRAKCSWTPAVGSTPSVIARAIVRQGNSLTTQQPRATRATAAGKVRRAHKNLLQAISAACWHDVAELVRQVFAYYKVITKSLPTTGCRSAGTAASDFHDCQHGPVCSALVPSPHWTTLEAAVSALAVGGVLELPAG